MARAPIPRMIALTFFYTYTSPVYIDLNTCFLAIMCIQIPAKLPVDLRQLIYYVYSNALILFTPINLYEQFRYGILIVVFIHSLPAT